MSHAKDKIRLQFDVTPETNEQIELLMRKVQIGTKKDFFENAYTLMKYCIQAYEKGYELAFVTETGEKIKIFGGFLENAKPLHTETVLSVKSMPREKVTSILKGTNHKTQKKEKETIEASSNNNQTIEELLFI